MAEDAMYISPVFSPSSEGSKVLVGEAVAVASSVGVAVSVGVASGVSVGVGSGAGGLVSVSPDGDAEARGARSPPRLTPRSVVS